jgi:hypothetical protein
MKRGIVFLMEDFIGEWMEWLTEGELTNVGLHKIMQPGNHSMEDLFVQLDDDFRRRIDLCEKRGITVEYELHILEWLLPRSLFRDKPTLFRMQNGKRVPEINCCASNSEALDIISENAYQTAKRLRQNSHDYFFWTDDADGYCECDLCRGIKNSDQNLSVVNAMLRGVRAYDSGARMSYLAYQASLEPPSLEPPSLESATVTPLEGIFLEFAPIARDIDKAINDETSEKNAGFTAALQNLFTVFKPEETHILEYWLDVAKFSGYKYPPVKVPFNPEIIERDVKYYKNLGVDAIKSFASYMGREYYELYGEPPIKEYGEILRG